MSQTLDKCILKISTTTTEKPAHPYLDLMRNYTKAHQEKCKTIEVDTKKVLRPTEVFCTGSKYEGGWDVLGMNGTGTYTYTNGVIYEGEFDDGVFHGTGQLKYPTGEILMGKFRNGRVLERMLVFADGLHYTDADWMYCLKPDRRFMIEYENGVMPAGKSYLTAEQPTRRIPEGCYDSGDGFYEPNARAVYAEATLDTVLRHLSDKEHDWTVANCRSDKNDEIGPRKELYEEWVEPELSPAPMQLPAGVSVEYLGSEESSGTFSDWSWECDYQFTSTMIFGNA